jgi:hypothetical protein
LNIKRRNYSHHPLLLSYNYNYGGKPVLVAAWRSRSCSYSVTGISSINRQRCGFHRSQHRLAEKYSETLNNDVADTSASTSTPKPNKPSNKINITLPPPLKKSPVPVESTLDNNMKTSPAEPPTTTVATESSLPSSPHLVPKSSPHLPPKPPKRVSNFVFTKFFNFVQGYNKILENNFPGAMQVYRVFVVGFKVGTGRRRK